MIYFHTSYCFLLDARVENEIFLCLQTVSTSFTCRSLQYWLHQERNIATVFRECSPPLTTDSFCWGKSFLLYIVLWININFEWHLHQEQKQRQMEHKQRTQREKEFRTLFAKTGNVRPSVRLSCLKQNLISFSVCPLWRDSRSAAGMSNKKIKVGHTSHVLYLDRKV